MVRADVVEKKIARAAAWLDSASVRFTRPLEELQADVALRDLAAFHFFLAAQEVIDLAAHWVADAGWTPPDDLGATFDILADHSAIPRDLADEMRAVVRVRNRIAHGYASLDITRMHGEIGAGVAGIRRFLGLVAAAAGADP